MNTSNYSFRSFTQDGNGRITVLPSLDGLRMQDHLVPVLDSITEALAHRPISCKLVLCIEDTEPFQVEWTNAGDTVGIARLIRVDTEAVLIVVSDANGSVDAAAMRSLHAQLTTAFESAGLDAAFDWALGSDPPLAALAYIHGKPSIGLDTLAMCLAAVFCDGSALVDLDG